MVETAKHPVDDEADAPDRDSSVNAVSDIESQRQLNDLRREYLEGRLDSVNQWLVVIGLVLAFFAVAIPVVTGIAAYVAYTQFQRIESEAQEHLDEAKRYASEAAQYLKDIKAQKEIAEKVVSELTSEDISKFVQSGTPEVSPEIESILRSIQLEPGTSVIDKAIVEAVRFQQAGKTDDAINQWSSIANISEGIDNDIAAGAFFARGSIKSSLGRHEEAISDANEAIRLKPNFAEVYLLRGLSNENLGRHEEAISDLNETIRLKPNDAQAYLFRGLSNGNWGKDEAAISDLNEAIRLKPNDAQAYYLRGTVKANLNKIEEAKADYQTALKIAEQQGNETLKTTLEGILQGFKDKE